MQAWAELSVGHLVELLNTVRNRILDFVLAIWKEAPEAGEGQFGVPCSIEPSRVTQIFNTTVYGGAANLVGNASNSPVSFNISQGNFESLAKVLADNGIQSGDIESLSKDIHADALPIKGKGFGPRVSAWIAAMIQKAADGSWNIGIGAAGTLLADAISRYYGLQ